MCTTSTARRRRKQARIVNGRKPPRYDRALDPKLRLKARAGRPSN